MAGIRTGKKVVVAYHRFEDLGTASVEHVSRGEELDPANLSNGRTDDQRCK
jgi:hypothetical protein